MKKLIVIFTFIFLSACTPAQIASEQDSHEHNGDEVHVHAGFQVYVNNQLQDFSDDNFMYFLPCGIDSEDQATVEDRVHLHDNAGDVAHIHAEHVTWRNLFESLAFDGDVEQGTFVINGTIDADLLDKDIKHFDSAVFFFGDNNAIDNKVANRVTKERIQEVDAYAFEKCGKN